jgi:hypothetical protein
MGRENNKKVRRIIIREVMNNKVSSEKERDRNMKKDKINKAELS